MKPRSQDFPQCNSEGTIGVEFLTFSVGGSEKVMPPHSSTLTWKVPWTEEPGGLQSMGSQRVGYD